MVDESKLYERLSYDWTDDSIRHFVSQSALSKSMPFFVQEVGDFKTFSPYYTERKNLLSYQIIFTMGGSGTLKYLGEEFTILPGDLFIIDCLKHHVYFTSPDETWDFLWIHFHGPASVSFYDKLYEDGFRPFNIERTFLVEAAMRRVLALCLKMPLGFEAFNSQSIHSILTELYIELKSGANTPGRTTAEIEEVRRYIHDHLTENISLDRLAKEYSMSKFHLSREFKRNLHITLNEYIITSRMNVAKELLRSTDWPIGKVAMSCGINHVSHFINLFKARENVTPLVYRKMWQSYSHENDFVNN